MTRSAKPVHLGLIGLGAFGQKIVKPLSFFHSEKEIKVTAVCDVQEDKVKRFATDLNVSHWFTDYREMIATADLDLVYIATPPATHKDIVLCALQHRKHILCEKPLANSVAEAEEIMIAAQKAGVVHALHFHMNNSPVYKKFVELFNEGYIGELRRVSVLMRYPSWPPAWQKNDWIDTRTQGGFVLEQGIHLIQAIQKAFGTLHKIESELQYPAHAQDGCETGILARMSLADDTPVLFDGLSGVPGEERVELTAYGTQGILTIKNWRTLEGAQVGEEVQEIQTDHPSTHPWIMQHVLQAIHGQPTDLCDFSVGYESQLVLEALRQRLPEPK